MDVAEICRAAVRKGASDIHLKVGLQPMFRTNGVFSLSQNIQYALEVPQGWFVRKQVRPGSMVMTEKGSLPKTYFPKR